MTWTTTTTTTTMGGVDLQPFVDVSAQQYQPSRLDWQLLTFAAVAAVAVDAAAVAVVVVVVVAAAVAAVGSFEQYY